MPEPVHDGGKIASAAIAFCRAQLGKKYVWGATGPNNFDCSGLLYAAFRSAGFPQITRVTYTQIVQGQAVATDAAGDLVFPDHGHVGISLGDGTILHAPQAGDVVKISKQWKKPVAIRRLVDPASGAGAISVTPAGDGSNPGDGWGPLGPLINLIAGIGTSIKWITDPHNWFRIALFFGGVFSLVVAFIMFANSSGNVSKVVKSAASVTR